VAEHEPTSGPAVNEDDPAYDPADTSATLPYSSARLRTRDLGDWRFGRVEIRARLPFGQGTWPAIWMLPTARVYGGWAASGEIDIMEAVNLGVDGENRVHGTLHYGSYWPNNVYSGAETTLPDGALPSDDFHDYAVEWERGEVRWYFDDHHFATQREDGWYTLYTDDSGQLVVGEGASPFDESFHLILNLAVGGAWAANVNAGGVDSSVFPQELVIEHVRVYECSVDPESGDGCDTIGDDYEVVPGHQPPQ
jgi:beta-glucanase (GH16 family)